VDHRIESKDEILLGIGILLQGLGLGLIFSIQEKQSSLFLRAVICNYLQLIIFFKPLTMIVYFVWIVNCDNILARFVVDPLLRERTCFRGESLHTKDVRFCYSFHMIYVYAYVET